MIYPSHLYGLMNFVAGTTAGDPVGGGPSSGDNSTVFLTLIATMFGTLLASITTIAVAFINRKPRDDAADEAYIKALEAKIALLGAREDNDDR